MVDIESADLSIGLDSNYDIHVSNVLFDGIENGQYNSKFYFKNELVIRNIKGEEDYLSTIFYLVNAFQEYHLID